jgi:hypothetical protein
MILSSVITLTIALIIGYFAYYFKKPAYLIFMLFLYATFHYSYSIVPIFNWNTDSLMVYRQTQPGVKLIGLLFFFFSLGLVFLHNRQDIFSKMTIKKGLWFWLASLAWGASVLISLFINISNGAFPSGLAIQDCVSTFLIWVSVWVYGTTLKTDRAPDQESPNVKKIYYALLMVLIVMVMLSMVQIMTERTFAGNLLPSGRYAYRASGLLYNPNVLGFWSGLVAILGAYRYHSNNQKVTSIFIMILSCVAIFLSGSRSGMFICISLFSSILLTLFLSKKIERQAMFYPFIIIISSFVIIGSSLKIANELTGGKIEEISKFTVLVDRFYNTPSEIMSYASDQVNPNPHSSYTIAPSIENDSQPAKSNSGTAIGIKARTAISKTIQVDSATTIPTDNAYIAMFADFGLSPVIIWVLSGIWLLILSIQTHSKLQSVESAYGINLIVACALSGLFMRSFQVFPFWVFVAILLSISFSIILSNSKEAAAKSASLVN